MQLPEIVYRREHPRPRIVYATYDIPESVRKQLPYRATVTWTYTSNADGLPSGQDLESVQLTEARIIELLAPQRAIFVGHILEAGRVVSVFHATAPVDSNVTVRAGLLGKQTFDVTNHHDPEWEFYEASIAPTDVDRLLFMSKPLFDKMRRDGDRAELPRPVDFAFWFSSAEGRASAISEAERRGFRVSEVRDEEGFFLELVKQTAICGEEFGECLGFAHDLATRHDGEFDGWASPVVR